MFVFFQHGLPDRGNRQKILRLVFGFALHLASILMPPASRHSGISFWDKLSDNFEVLLKSTPRSSAVGYPHIAIGHDL
jgi:hypothetical protein